MTNSDIRNKIMAYIKEAPPAFDGYGPSPNFGKITYTPYVVVLRKGQSPEYIKFSEWQGDLDKNQMEIWFELDIKEFNPNLQWDFIRKVRIEMNLVDEKGNVKIKTDWNEIVLPSLLEAIGEDWAAKMDAGLYVEIVDVDSFRKPYHKKVNGVEQFNDDGSPAMTQPQTIKFLRAFPDKEACLKAHNERYSKSDSGRVTDVNASQIPADVAEKAKTLRASFSDEQFKSQFAVQEPFNNYDVDALMAASNPL